MPSFRRVHPKQKLEFFEVNTICLVNVKGLQNALNFFLRHRWVHVLQHDSDFIEIYAATFIGINQVKHFTQCISSCWERLFRMKDNSSLKLSSTTNVC